MEPEVKKTKKPEFTGFTGLKLLRDLVENKKSITNDFKEIMINDVSGIDSKNITVSLQQGNDKVLFVFDKQEQSFLGFVSVKLPEEDKVFPKKDVSLRIS